MQQVLNNSHVNIELDTEKKRLYQTWKGYVTVEDFKLAIDVSVDYFRKYQLNTILSDTTEQAVLAKEGSDYAASVMPVLVELGMKKIAFVLPKSFFAKLSLENFTKNTNSQWVGQFPGREEAEAWLDEL